MYDRTTHSSKPILYIVMPALNEEQVLQITIDAVVDQISTLISKNVISNKSSVCVVDDHSSDKTWDIVCQNSTNGRSKYVNICGIKLSKQQGHQNALMAGMMTFMDRCDCIITMDSDMQDDPSIIPDFVNKYLEGFDIVYGVRANRDVDGKFKRGSANCYYKLLKGWGVDVVNDHADYRLVSKAALKALSKYGESNLFLRGIVPLLGFNSCEILYERGKRQAGKTKYSLRKMLAFAFEGIFSFSVKPISIITFVGFAAILLGLIVGVWTIITMVQGKAILGWASTIMSIWILGGFQLIALGIVGQYIAKIYLETKRRPTYIIQDEVNSGL